MLSIGVCNEIDRKNISPNTWNMKNISEHHSINDDITTSYTLYGLIFTNNTFSIKYVSIYN